VRIRFASHPHHFPVEPLGVDVWGRWGVVGCFFGGVGAFLSTLLGEVFGVVYAPSLLVCEVSLEVFEEGCVERDFAALELLPGAVGAGGGDGVVYPAWGDVVGDFVV
jgi:hypothetical protein